MRALYHDLMPLIKKMIEDDKETIAYTASYLGVSTKVVERCCRNYNLKTQRTGPRGGDKHFCWKGGRKLVGNYWYIYSKDHPNKTKDGYVAEHRLEMEKHIGRYLERSEVVHHIDGDPSNNSIENLQLFRSNSDHLKHELTGKNPNWTEDGVSRIIEGILKSANRRRLKSDDDQLSRSKIRFP